MGGLALMPKTLFHGLHNTNDMAGWCRLGTIGMAEYN